MRDLEEQLKAQIRAGKDTGSLETEDEGRTGGIPRPLVPALEQLPPVSIRMPLDLPSRSLFTDPSQPGADISTTNESTLMNKHQLPSVPAQHPHPTQPIPVSMKSPDMVAADVTTQMIAIRSQPARAGMAATTYAIDSSAWWNGDNRAERLEADREARTYRRDSSDHPLTESKKSPAMVAADVTTQILASRTQTAESGLSATSFSAESNAWLNGDNRAARQEADKEARMHRRASPPVPPVLDSSQIIVNMTRPDLKSGMTATPFALSSGEWWNGDNAAERLEADREAKAQRRARSLETDQPTRGLPHGQKMYFGGLDLPELSAGAFTPDLHRSHRTVHQHGGYSPLIIPLTPDPSRVETPGRLPFFDRSSKNVPADERKSSFETCIGAIRAFPLAKQVESDQTLIDGKVGAGGHQQGTDDPKTRTVRPLGWWLASNPSNDFARTGKEMQRIEQGELDETVKQEIGTAYVESDVQRVREVFGYVC